MLVGVGAASYLAVPTAARLLASSVETAVWNGALKSIGSDHDDGAMIELVEPSLKSHLGSGVLCTVQVEGTN